jgi:hypothetical protein
LPTAQGPRQPVNVGCFFVPPAAATVLTRAYQELAAELHDVKRFPTRAELHCRQPDRRTVGRAVQIARCTSLDGVVMLVLTLAHSDP